MSTVTLLFGEAPGVLSEVGGLRLGREFLRPGLRLDGGTAEHALRCPALLRHSLTQSVAEQSRFLQRVVELGCEMVPSRSGGGNFQQTREMLKACLATLQAQVDRSQILSRTQNQRVQHEQKRKHRDEAIAPASKMSQDLLSNRRQTQEHARLKEAKAQELRAPLRGAHQATRRT